MPPITTNSTASSPPLHQVDYVARPVWAITVERVQYIERQVARWSKQYQAAGAERIDAMDAPDRMATVAHSRG